MNFNEIFDLMQMSFPTEEFRNYNSQKALLNENNYHITTKLNHNKKTIAFIATWDFPEFIFIEHFAVDKSLRGHGIGSSMIKEFLAKTSKNIILEVEPEHDVMSLKRIKFYKKFGFHLNNFHYMQKPLRNNSPIIELKIMSYPEKLSFDNFQKIKDVLYSEVYSKV